MRCLLSSDSTPTHQSHENKFRVLSWKRVDVWSCHWLSLDSFWMPASSRWQHLQYLRNPAWAMQVISHQDTGVSGSSWLCVWKIILLSWNTTFILVYICNHSVIRTRTRVRSINTPIPKITIMSAMTNLLTTIWPNSDNSIAPNGGHAIFGVETICAIPEFASWYRWIARVSSRSVEESYIAIISIGVFLFIGRIPGRLRFNHNSDYPDSIS